MSRATRIERGDWQTPRALADAIVRSIARANPGFATIIEPTCGEGAFLSAAAAAFPEARLLGFDVSAEYIESARAALAGHDAALAVGDFFTLDWSEILSQCRDPILLLGNPPWVTNSTIGALAGTNLPPKHNHERLRGLDALTGKSNFDISEWMILRLLEAIGERSFMLAMLCKASVAHKLMRRCASRRWPIAGELRTIDARTHFAAAVDAVLLSLRRADPPPAEHEPLRWPAYASLDAAEPQIDIGVVDGRPCSDVDAFLATRALEGDAELQWRSGIKHDCAKLMELERGPTGLINGFGERVELEDEYLFPLLKGSDLAKGPSAPRRWVIVTQRRLGAETSEIRERAPATWRYLQAHRELLAARKSSIYVGQPDFAMFGIGEYAFAPHKVAIGGLYKQLAFTLVSPHAGKPVMVDDTAYFLPCTDEAQARELAAALASPSAQAFFEARVFWSAKRPITKALLQSLSLVELLRACGRPPELLGA